jgi:predicted cupin superfamily sugar epimerase
MPSFIQNIIVNESNYKNAQYWVEKFEMLEHPEGGYFAETYRSTESIPQEALPERFKGKEFSRQDIYFY